MSPAAWWSPSPVTAASGSRRLAEFAAEFVAYLSEFEHRDDTGMCPDAPQLVVPNVATADWLGGIVGRFTRNLRTDGDAPAPPSVPLAGKHLSFFADPLPGSSLVLAATDALTTHWQTGQLPSEDLNLAALLGWIDPPAGMDGRQAARAGETSPPAGPDSDPNWDAEIAGRADPGVARRGRRGSPVRAYDASLRARSASSSPQRGQTAGGRSIASTPCRLPTTSPADGSRTGAAGPTTATESPRAERTSATSPRRSRPRPG